MPEDDTPRTAAKQRIEDFIVSEMRSGFEKVHDRIDEYRGEAQKSNATLLAHIETCDKRYGEMLSARRNGTNRAMSRNWIMERIKERAFDYALVAVVLLVIYALTHGAHLPIPG